MKLGWVYEYAAEDNQRDKEDMTILERALLNEQESINEENPITLPSPKSHCNVRCAYIKMRRMLFQYVHPPCGGRLSYTAVVYSLTPLSDTRMDNHPAV